jgi:hypothetical protein
VQLAWHEFFALGRAELRREMVAAIICREMKWDWETFQSQPNWFIDVILAMLQEEAAEANRRNKS